MNDTSPVIGIAERLRASDLASRIKGAVSAGQRPSLADGSLSDEELLLIYRALKLMPTRQGGLA